MKNIAAVVELAKAEIISDVKAGVVPAPVASFSELHDYVDANEYGGLCDDSNPLVSDLSDADAETLTAFWNDVQSQVDEWIKTGGIKDSI